MAVERVVIVGGTGEEGFGLASRWAAAGLEVIIGSRDRERGEAAADRLKDLVPDARARGLQNSDAVAQSDVVVVTVPFSGQAAIYKSFGDQVRAGAVVVDCTVPVAAAVGGRPSHVLGVWQGSAAQQAAALLPKGRASLCAAFHSLSASALNDLGNPLEGDVLVCGGTNEAKATVEELIDAIQNLRFVNAGPLENARIVEPITALLIGINHRYGTDRAGIKITGID
jgi:NADPH-dependent F420 reductase